MELESRDLVLSSPVSHLASSIKFDQANKRISVNIYALQLSVYCLLVLIYTVHYVRPTQSEGP